MSLVAHRAITLPPTIVIDSQDTLDRLIAQVKEEIFKNLKPEDHAFLIESSRLLSLRDSNPSKCIGESNILFNDHSVPRCWRARAGVYRAESFMKLGFEDFAKQQLNLAGRVLETDEHLQPIDLIDRKRHEILEGLVAWNIALGKINWGIIDPERVFNFSIAKAGSTTTITTSGKLFSAGYPSSFSLSALDLKYC
ncbi:hypothetical protein PCANC_12232 [Puccinia coronata f. sp. avenae]|uniref:Uncharacterized protein n=1 Tax=Puccinia coronata f. sp. avenae TaxID=200324 RepID=A0A2N5TC10_9BASI|nr:hypothetical protein PCANC_15596 [Puccinia coronata f. sp. avenae]PLW23012.1 hypothetical protein PCASD_14074 [Puccinia coronata f. sp. avenae]PLW26549.1 hypothetical protein PCANC_24106 [Puccinia coronata f. sp. avenae]PLW34687.1 hypothetical protein PCANC_12232 [Puccinia coronata f. sp. avenae]PLW44688.1 hypothetical protein PCASD_05859 [Puccinia coronata f. sp. avenae]